MAVKKRKFTRIVETFDRLAESYGGPEGLEEVNRLALAGYARMFRGMVLDVGCGSGTFMEKYHDRTRQRLVSVDFSYNMILVAQRRLEALGRPASFVHGLAQQLPFRDATFDGCVCVNTLHNMPRWEDAAEALREMSRVLKPGGAMVVEFRNIENAERKRITQLYDWPHLPQKAFTSAQVAEILMSAGMEIIERIPLYGENPGEPRSSLKSLTGRRAPRIGMIAVRLDK